jgi:hypothetical protein
MLNASTRKVRSMNHTTSATAMDLVQSQSQAPTLRRFEEGGAGVSAMAGM